MIRPPTTLVVLAGLSMVAVAAPGAAQSDGRAEIVLFDSAPADATTGVKVTEYFVGDDFSPAVSATATTVTVELGDWNGDFPTLFDGLIRWSVHTNDLGDPGPEIARGTAVDVTYSEVSPPGGCVYSACYHVRFHLGQQVPLLDSVLYWLVLNVNRGLSPSELHSWIKASALNSNHAHFRGDAGPWTDAGFDVTFSVVGSTDAPYLFADGFETGDTSVWQP